LISFLTYDSDSKALNNRDTIFEIGFGIQGLLQERFLNMRERIWAADMSRQSNSRE